MVRRDLVSVFSRKGQHESDDLYDKDLICCDCGMSFVFGAGEQEFFREKGYQAAKRCPPCRSAKRARYAVGL
jgi:hypothetical protein